jgi:hypothetical protein
MVNADGDAHFCTIAWSIADHAQPLANATSLGQIYAQFCLPRNCTADDMKDASVIFDLFPLDWIMYEIIMIPDSQGFKCMDQKPPITSFNGAVIMIVISSILVGVTLIATLMDYAINHDCLSSVHQTSLTPKRPLAVSPVSHTGLRDPGYYFDSYLLLPWTDDCLYVHVTQTGVRLTHLADDDFKKPAVSLVAEGERIDDVEVPLQRPLYAINISLSPIEL